MEANLGDHVLVLRFLVAELWLLVLPVAAGHAAQALALMAVALIAAVLVATAVVPERDSATARSARARRRRGGESLCRVGDPDAAGQVRARAPGEAFRLV